MNKGLEAVDWRKVNPIGKKFATVIPEKRGDRDAGVIVRPDNCYSAYGQTMKGVVHHPGNHEDLMKGDVVHFKPFEPVDFYLEAGKDYRPVPVEHRFIVAREREE